MAAALVMVGVIPYTQLAESHTPISDVYGVMLGQGAFYFGLAGMAASNYAALNATFLATARVTYSMGRDQYVPKVFHSVNPRLKTPIPALILTLIVVSVFAASSNVEFVAAVSDFGYLIGLSIVNACVIILHRKGLSVPGTFRAKFYPLVPILGVITCLILVPTLHFEALLIGGILSIVGLILYAGYGRGKKHETFEDWKHVYST
jgi:APA family basic amino acid/polyamine antiporter